MLYKLLYVMHDVDNILINKMISEGVSDIHRLIKTSINHYEKNV